MRLALPLRELEQLQRALDVDLVRQRRRELAARREQRREVEDQIDLELGEQALEQPVSRIEPVNSRATSAGQRRVERRQVERDDRPAAVGGERA